MVLTLHFDEGYLTSKEFQGRKHLQTLDQRHVRIGIAMQQQQGCVNLVSIEKRTLVHKELTMTPRITVSHRHLAVVIAPIALAPITGVIGDASMRNGCCEEVCLRLQILCHKTTIRGSHTSNLLGIDEGMGLAEFLRALDDILSRTTTSRIHMTRGPLLSKTCGTTGLEDISHIA